MNRTFVILMLWSVACFGMGLLAAQFLR